MPTSSEKVPLMGKSSAIKTTAVGQYLSTCQEYSIRPSADALIRLDLGSPHLMLQHDKGEEFGNLDLQALVMLLEEEDGARLRCFKSLDLSKSKLGSSGVLLVARLLQHKHCALEELDLSFQELGCCGAEAVAGAVRKCPTLRSLRLHTCKLFDAGAQAFVTLLEDGRGAHGLEKLDLQNNFIEYAQCRALMRMAQEHSVEVQLEGNRVLDELFNAITHGLGFIAVAVGSVFMYLEAERKPSYYMWGVVPYCISMNVLFLSSCLYHSFHALGHIVTRVFCILDHSAIYALIAGTYTPFLVILFRDRWWSPYFVLSIWSLALAGIAFTVTYNGPGKIHIENAFYLVMGWGCVLFIRDAYLRLPPAGFALLVGGGVLYSAGVPWFVKDGHTLGFPDHVMWHLFVLAACACHFICIFWYVVHPGLDEVVKVRGI